MYVSFHCLPCLPELEAWSGGKVDDTSVVVGEIIEWTEAHTQIWSEAGYESCPLVFRSSAITFWLWLQGAKKSKVERCYFMWWHAAPGSENWEIIESQWFEGRNQGRCCDTLELRCGMATRHSCSCEVPGSGPKLWFCHLFISFISFAHPAAVVSLLLCP